MAPNLAISIVDEIDLDQVIAFYVSSGRRVEPTAGDTLFAARTAPSGQLIGAVWLNRGFGSCVLRKMYVSDNHRGQGVGASLLETAVDSLTTQECWCISWSYLDEFYGTVGFVKKHHQSAPRFLEDRFNGYLENALDIVLLHRKARESRP